MKKMLKIIEIITLVIAAVSLITLVILSRKAAVPANYQKKTETGGETEAYYMQNGSHDVLLHEEPVLQEFEKYLVCYPADMETNDGRYPVIVICNGSGTPLSKYSAVAKHYASWGFIVIGTEEKYAWNAFGAEMCIRYLERMNENEKLEDTTSFLYKKVDFGHVGIVGHSQGGVGVLNAITNTEHKDIYKTAVSLSPTNKTLAHNLMWDYDASLVNIPIMLISGAGGGDDWVVTKEQLQEIYDAIPSEKLMMRRKDTAHNQVLYKPDGYVTAWFMWQLQGDDKAAGAFTGDHPEVLSNELYQDQKINVSD